MSDTEPPVIGDWWRDIDNPSRTGEVIGADRRSVTIWSTHSTIDGYKTYPIGPFMRTWMRVRKAR